MDFHKNKTDHRNNILNMLKSCFEPSSPKANLSGKKFESNLPKGLFSLKLCKLKTLITISCWCT